MIAAIRRFFFGPSFDDVFNERQAQFRANYLANERILADLKSRANHNPS